MPTDLNTVERYHPDINTGLTKREVKERISKNLVNIDKAVAAKSTKQIIKDNTLTLFNLINLILAIAILCVGSHRNLMFMGVVICNSGIGIWQELRAKRIIENLNLISSSSISVIRDGNKKRIKIEKIVLDDIICLKSGDQIPADCIICEGNCEVNESLLTGESDLISKKNGNMLLSGSYIVSGQCKAKIEHIGENNFSSVLLKGAKYIKKTKSEIITTINKIVKVISIAIIPLGALLFYRQFISSGHDYALAIVTTSAALTGMIPEGLVLLTSSVLAVGVMRLSKQKVLVQDIYCLETLARVDTLCLDKTGTLTESAFELHDVIPAPKIEKSDAEKLLTRLISNTSDTNETFKAIKNKYYSADKVTDSVKTNFPFSSEKKWSGISFSDGESIIIGAAEFVFKNQPQSQAIIDAKKYSQEYRVLALARSKTKFGGNELPNGLEYVALILIKDKIRNTAEKTLRFFASQSVDIKIISGDDPMTVSQIAKRVQLNNYDKYIDARKLNSEAKIAEAVSKYTIFGRVTPTQKQQIIKALKTQGHTVAMVGDGVNDVLAMKEADCSVAMASGSDIACNVAHLVLLTSNFATMPLAVAEGRKTINNLQRSSSLFLVKTIYSFVLSVLFLFIPAPYPFIPIQMTLLSALTIGVPSFILGLEPNREKINGNLLKNIVSKSLPAAISIVFSILMCVSIYSIFNISQDKYSTLNVFLTAIIGFALLYKISVPFNRLRRTLLWGVVIAFAIAVIKYHSFFEFEPLNWVNILILIPLTFAAMFVYECASTVNFKKTLQKFSFKKAN